MKVGFVFIATLLLISPALAQTVEVAPGVRVAKHTFSVPISEQPFFGFAAKPPAQIAADEKFVSQIVHALGSRQRAMDETLKRGWIALGSGDVVTAGRRFNDAYLIGPEQSRVYHAFAALADTRFHDTEYAGQLFKIALEQSNPAPTVRADYGRLLLTAKRPREARPMLEAAVAETPTSGTAWSNLAFARL